MILDNDPLDILTFPKDLNFRESEPPTTCPDATVAAPEAGAAVPLSAYKREALEKQRAALLQEYQTASDQLFSALNAADRVRIERQLAGLEQQIGAIESKLGQ